MQIFVTLLVHAFMAFSLHSPGSINSNNSVVRLFHHHQINSTNSSATVEF